MIPTDAAERKDLPLFTGCLMYFPDALVAVAELSRIGNDQHNPGKPMHWDRSKSGDELDALMRHLIEAGTIDTDGVRHSTKVAWRALANLQKEIENERTNHHTTGQYSNDPLAINTECCREPVTGDSERVQSARCPTGQSDQRNIYFDGPGGRK